MTDHPQLAPLIDQLLDQLARRIIALQHAPGPPAAPTPVSPWMSIQAAASYLDWPRQRLYKLTARGEVPHYKQDGRLLFHRHELDTWLSQHAQGERPQTNAKTELC